VGKRVAENAFSGGRQVAVNAISGLKFNLRQKARGGNAFSGRTREAENAFSD